MSARAREDVYTCDCARLCRGTLRRVSRGQYYGHKPFRGPDSRAAAVTVFEGGRTKMKRTRTRKAAASGMLCCWELYGKQVLRCYRKLGRRWAHIESSVGS